MKMWVIFIPDFPNALNIQLKNMFHSFQEEYSHDNVKNTEI